MKALHPLRVILTPVFLLLLRNSGSGQAPRWDIVWDPPILLSDTTIGVEAFIPHIALSGDDIVHVTWWGGAELWPYARSTDGGLTFTRRDLMSDTSTVSITTRPNIVASESTVIALATLPRPQGLDPTIMARSHDAGATWDSVRVVLDSSSEFFTPAISRDTVTFTFVPPPGYMEILRSTNSGNTWSRTYQRFRIDSRATSANGMLHIVVIACSSGYCGLEYRRSRNLGDTWEDVKFVRPPEINFLPQDPTIVARSSADGDYVLAMWRDRMFGCGSGFGCTLVGRIGKVEADSTRWLPVRVLTTIPIGYAPELAGSKTGFAAMWPMDQESTPFAEVRVSEDTVWSMSYDPVVLPATAAVNVGIALSSSAVHVVWAQKMITDTDHYQTMYRRGRLVSTAVVEDGRIQEGGFGLLQNYPNPFNGETAIEFQTSGRNAQRVSLRILDILGKEVALLLDGILEPGLHSLRWNTNGAGSGVYFYQLASGNGSIVRKMILIR